MRDPRTAQAVRPYHAALSDAMRHYPTQQAEPAPDRNPSLPGYMVASLQHAQGR